MHDICSFLGVCLNLNPVRFCSIADTNKVASLSPKNLYGREKQSGFSLRNKQCPKFQFMVSKHVFIVI